MLAGHSAPDRARARPPRWRDRPTDALENSNTPANKAPMVEPADSDLVAHAERLLDLGWLLLPSCRPIGDGMCSATWHHHAPEPGQLGRMALFHPVQWKAAPAPRA